VLTVACTVGVAACGGRLDADVPGAEIDAASTPDVLVWKDAGSPSPDTSADGSNDAEGNPAVDAFVDTFVDALDADEPRCASCSAYGAATALGPVPAKLPELSGLAASRLHQGILYAHNDSGDAARFFALNRQAQIEAEIDLTGAVATDWEDVAVGPCPGGSCVFLGDIGDNSSRRTEYAIYRVAEPETLPADGSAISVTYDRIPFVYPDGAHNAETLLVHPASGRIFLVTKVGGFPATVYEAPLPLNPDQTATLVRVTALSLPALAGVVTGGSFHPCANRLLVRTYGALYELSGTASGALDALFVADPVQVPAAIEPQGEAVTYAIDGRSYFTASETVAGAPPAELSVVSCP
jgi:hypothetical protein